MTDKSSIMVCPICSTCFQYEFFRSVVCQTCVKHVRSLAYAGGLHVSGHKIHAGFFYESTLRDLIIRAKVKNEVPALSAILSIMAEIMGPVLLDFNAPDCLIVAAPSSLRSRLLGCFDIAQVVRSCLFPAALHTNAFIHDQFWRSKRAGRNHYSPGGERSHWSTFFHSHLKKFKNMHIIFKKDFNFTENVLASSKILVVDDVLTTGFTMGTLIHHLKRLGAHRIEGLVVAARAPV